MHPEMSLSPAAAAGRPLPVEPTPMAVFTAVDGALRDPDTRSWSGARAALQLLAAQNVPLVLVSHQGAAELLALQRDLGIRQPFVAESGAALYVPRDYFADLPGLGISVGDWEVVEFGERRDVVCDALYEVGERLAVPIIGFSRMSAEQLAVHQGVSVREATLALQREYDEPFVLPGGDAGTWPRLYEAMRRAGFRCYAGPQFHHATAVQDPAHAIRLLISLYRLGGDGLLVVGLGDDWSDRVLLREVDVPVVVRNPRVNQKRLLRKVPSAYLTTAAGPAGWSEAILGSLAA